MIFGGGECVDVPNLAVGDTVHKGPLRNESTAIFLLFDILGYAFVSWKRETPPPLVARGGVEGRMRY